MNDNRIIVSPNPSPSPAPSPAPTNSIVIKAVSMHDDFKVRDYTDNSIEIRMMNSYGHYSVILSETEEFWIEHSKYFQNNFEIFRKIVKQALIVKTGDVSYSIIKEDMKEIVLKLEYHSLFYFNVSITLENEMNKIMELQNENKLLKEKIQGLLKKEKISNSKTQGWTRIRHANAWSGNNPQSVKDFDEAKKICIESNYGGFIDCSKHSWYGIRTQAPESKGGPNYVLNNLCKGDRSITEKPWGDEKGGRIEWDGDTILSPGADFHLIKQKQDEGYEIVWDKKDYGILEELGIVYMLS